MLSAMETQSKLHVGNATKIPDSHQQQEQPEEQQTASENLSEPAKSADENTKHSLIQKEMLNRLESVESVGSQSNAEPRADSPVQERHGDRTLDVWLDSLATSAELETMSILYAKSVLDPITSSQLGAQRVAITCKQSAKNEPTMANATTNCADREVKKDNDEKFKDGVEQKLVNSKMNYTKPVNLMPQIMVLKERYMTESRSHNERTTGGSLSSGASQSSSGNDDEDEDGNGAVALHTDPEIPELEEIGGSMPTRFSLSMPSAKSMQLESESERVQMSRSTASGELSANMRIYPTKLSKQNSEKTQPGPSSPSLPPPHDTPSQDGRQHQPQSMIYRPKVELRSSRHLKVDFSAGPTRHSVSAVLAQNVPPTFRHSIRVNGDDSATELSCDRVAAQPAVAHAARRNGAVHHDSNRRTTCTSSRIYETIAESAQFDSEMRQSVNGIERYDAAIMAGRRQRFCASPNLLSSRSSSDGTTDSGQDSAGSLLATAPAMATMSPPLPPRRPQISPPWPPVQRRNQGLPGYIRVASCLDQVLRSASALNAALHGASARFRPEVASCALRFSIVGERGMRELLDCAISFIRLVRETACAPYFINSPNFESVERASRRFNRGGDEQNMSAHGALNARNHFIVVSRQMLEQSMLIFVRIVCDYLKQCTNTESLLPIALEHLVQSLLFGDDVCLDAVKCGAVERIAYFIRLQTTPLATRRLLLRTLAMLCATSRGCLQLLAIEDGLDTIVRILCATPADTSAAADVDAMSVEAAGVLTQLTRPTHELVALSDECVSACVCRLLHLVDVQRCRYVAGHSDAHEALLLCCASLANLSLKGGDAGGSDADEVATSGNGGALIARLLYEQNAARHLILAVDALRQRRGKQRQANSPLFVQEQVLTVLSRMASRGYSQALLAQGAVPFLLKIFGDCADVHASSANLSPSSQRYMTAAAASVTLPSGAARRQSSEFYRRVCYKAVVCLGMLASSSAGLKALYDSRGYGEVCEVLRSEAAAGSSSPLALICASLKQRLEASYEVESAV